MSRRVRQRQNIRRNRRADIKPLSGLADNDNWPTNDEEQSWMRLQEQSNGCADGHSLVCDSHSGLDLVVHPDCALGPDDNGEFYDSLLEKFQAEGPTLANHGKNTKAMIQEQERQWAKFCEYRKLDATEALLRCDASLFKIYLVWRVKNSRMRKASSATTYWKILSMVYSLKAASWMKENVMFDIRNWIRVYLTPAFGLDTSKKEKSGIFVEDLVVLLSHHWIQDKEVFAHERLRVQFAANLILAGATATRSGALIGQLLYQHLEFQLFPSLPGRVHPRVVLKVNLKHIKRSGGESDPKEFAFREDDMLIYDPLVPIMALAFADDAFANELIDPGDLYKLAVPANADRLRLLWKEEWLDRPVFRDVEHSPHGIQVSQDRALRYARERGHLIRLGRSIGLAKSLEWYDLRRGSGKKLNEALTPEERNKIMGHRQGDSSVYVQYYMSNFNDADCQSICFGSAPQHDLVHLAGRLLRHGDAPTALTNQQMLEVSQDPRLVACRQKRAMFMELVQSQYGTRAAADGTEAARLYDYWKKRTDSISKTLVKERLQQAITDFHKSIHVEEVDRQLNGIRPSREIAPTAIQYELVERARVARLFSQTLDKESSAVLYPLRMDLTRALVQLCKRRESPCRRRKGGVKKNTSTPLASPVSLVKTQDATPVSPTTKPAPNMGTALLFCPFCRWADPEVGEAQREKLWRLDSLARHIRTQHLNRMQAPFDCPYNGCLETLCDGSHFANHMKRRHNIHLPPTVIQVGGSTNKAYFE